VSPDGPAALEALTPENTTVVLIDYGLGFANVFRTPSLAQNQNNAALLADLALRFGSGLVVTNGPQHKASGPYYPNVLDVLGDHPVVERGGMFNAFLFDGFAEAVAATGRRNLVIGGLVTEGCVLQTALGGLREGYQVHVAVDACGAQSVETHQTAITRMTMAGVVPVTAFALASEFTVDQDGPNGPAFFALTAAYEPEMTALANYFTWAQGDARGGGS
jgi:isochorismate hydrolase